MRLGWPHLKILVLNDLLIETPAASIHNCIHLVLLENDFAYTAVF